MPAPPTSRSHRARPCSVPTACAAGALAAFTAFAASAGPRDPLLRWTDAEGAVRYTTEAGRIPLLHRGEAVRVELPLEPDPFPPIPGSDAGAGIDAEAEANATAPDPGEALPAVESEPPGDETAAPSALAQRIAEIQAAIAADQDRIADLISDPEQAAALVGSDEIDVIAERLPRLQKELRALREQREAPDPTGPR